MRKEGLCGTQMGNRAPDTFTRVTVAEAAIRERILKVPATPRQLTGITRVAEAAIRERILKVTLLDFFEFPLATVAEAAIRERILKVITCQGVLPSFTVAEAAIRERILKGEIARK